MTSPLRYVARTKKVTADNEAPGDAMNLGSDERMQPDCKPGIEHHVIDDAAGDEGIDEPAVND